MAHTNPELRILEIGAGTAGTTQSILTSLGGEVATMPQFSEYIFTDVSPGFFEKAQEVLHRWASYLQYKVLNIEIHPRAQDFIEGDRDLIIAANVLHVTKNIDESLKHVRSLLAPGGKLCLIEYTNPGMRVSTIFGCLPGWWR